MSVNVDEFFTKVCNERNGRDVLVSPAVFWDLAQQLMAKVELFYWDSADVRGTEIIRVTEKTGEKFLLVSDPDAPIDPPHYAKVAP